MKILYIEDRDTYHRTMRRLAATMGHELLTAVDGAQGYTLAKLPVDLILLDINLPDGNGLELARRLRAENVRTPIIVVSADVMNYTRDDALEAGCNDFIAKPFEVLLMQKAIERCLAQASDQSLQQGS